MSADFQILHCPMWRRFTHSGSGVMYLSLLSVSVTVKKCDRIFFSQIKAVNIKIPWAFLKFSKIHECKKVSTSESPTPSIFAQKRGRIVHIHKKLRNLELCVILNVYKKTISPQIHID